MRGNGAIEGVMRTSKVTAIIASAMATCISVVQPVGAQPPAQVVIRGVPVALGMSRADFLAKLQDYHLQCASRKPMALADCNSIMVMSKSTPATVYGNATFKDGKVSWVAKHWSQAYEGTEPTRFANALISILKAGAMPNIDSEGSTTIALNYREVAQPDLSYQVIEFIFGGKVISMTTFDEGVVEGQKIPPTVTLDEILRE